MPKVHEEALPLGASPKYDLSPNNVITYINKAKQLAKAGPGLATFECPLIPNLSRGEVQRFVGEIHKTMPNVEIRVIDGGPGLGIGIMAVAIDPTFKAPVPTKVDLKTVGGDVHHKRLWEVCREQGDYLARDTNNHDKPDCSAGCRYFMPLEGKHGMDWGVCTEPRSPRAGLLTFEHMGCQYFEQEPDDDVGEAPKAPKRAKKSGVA